MSNDLGMISAVLPSRVMRRAAPWRSLSSLAACCQRPARPTIRSRAPGSSTTSGSFEAAVSAAEQARQLPARADAADLVAARAYLERFRESAAADDLTNARDRLRRLDPAKFPPRERAEYIVGLGEALFFDDAFGAAATCSTRCCAAATRCRPTRASACSTGGRPRSIATRSRGRRSTGRASISGSATRMRRRARDASRQRHRRRTGWRPPPGRRAICRRAWDAAQAGWVRAPLTGDHGAALRADLDRLVVRRSSPTAPASSASPRRPASAVGTVQGPVEMLVSDLVIGIAGIVRGLTDDAGNRNIQSSNPAIPRQSPNHLRCLRSARVPPVLADADIDRQRHVQRRG